MESENVIHDIAVAFLEFVEQNPNVPVTLQVELEGLSLELEYRAHLLGALDERYIRRVEARPQAAGV